MIIYYYYLYRDASDIEITSQIDLTEYIDVPTNTKSEHKIRLLGTIRSVSKDHAIAPDFSLTDTDLDYRHNDTTTTLETYTDYMPRHDHNQIVHQMQQQPVTIGKVLWYMAKTPSLCLLLFASFYRNCGGYVWGYQADNYFVNETLDDNYTVATWLGWVPMVAGSIGCLLGGIISDKLAGNTMSSASENLTLKIQKTVIQRIWVLVIANLMSFPFAAGVLLIDSPYCYLSLFGMYLFSEMWISVAITLVIEFSPSNMRATMLSVYYFCVGLAGFAPLLVTVVERWMNSYKWSMFILFPCVYGSSSILFFFVIFTYQRDLRKRGALSFLDDHL